MLSDRYPAFTLRFSTIAILALPTAVATTAIFVASPSAANAAVLDAATAALGCRVESFEIALARTHRRFFRRRCVHLWLVPHEGVDIVCQHDRNICR